MKLKIVIAIGFFVLLLIGARLVAQPSSPRFAQSTMQINLSTGQTVDFTIEVARTPQEQEYGLMFRKHLDDHAGMIFIEQPPQVMAMWMKNTLIPLDMLFVDSEGVIRRITPDAVPESEAIISSVEPVTAVVELAGGAVARLGIKPGDRLTSPALQDKPAHP